MYLVWNTLKMSQYIFTNNTGVRLGYLNIEQRLHICFLWNDCWLTEPEQPYKTGRRQFI